MEEDTIPNTRFSGKSPRESLLNGLHAYSKPAKVAHKQRLTRATSSEKKTRKRAGRTDIEHAAHHLCTIVVHFRAAIRSAPTSSTRPTKSMILNVAEAALENLSSKSSDIGFEDDIDGIIENAMEQAEKTREKRSDVARAKMALKNHGEN